MAQRKRIGFLFSYDEGWIGGTYYVLNIIEALNTLEDEKKPAITILSSKKEDFELVATETQYPHLKFELFPRKLTLVENVVNKVSRFFTKKNVFHFTSKLKDVEFIYPNYNPKIKNPNIKKVYWIPDFQEEFLPEYFTKNEIESRKNHQRMISDSGDVVVFSSKDAASHYNSMYPVSKPNQFVLPFAVTHPDFSKLNTNEILRKHKLPEKYFFTPNQFWAHKNHLTIIKALNQLKLEGLDVVVAFSGKEYDNRTTDSVSEIKSYIKNNNLENNVLFLGFLDRKEQLLIQKNAIAVVQPSLFEGWSTVVEDSKSLSKFIILSDLNVHYEQINENCAFFEKTNEKQLAELLNKYYVSPPEEVGNSAYSIKIKKFAENFIKLIENTVK